MILDTTLKEMYSKEGEFKPYLSIKTTHCR